MSTVEDHPWSNDILVDGSAHRLEIIDYVMREAAKSCTVSVSEVLKERPDRDAGNTPWRLRVRSFRALRIGQVSENTFYNVIASCLFEIQRAVELTWKIGDWSVLAWEVKRVRELVKTPSIQKVEAYNYLKGEPSPQRTRFVDEYVEQLEISVVLVDSMRSDDEDPFYESTGRPGPNFKYSETKEYRHMPKFLRRQVARAIEIMEAFDADAARQPQNDAPNDSDSGLTTVQVSAAASLHDAGATWRSIADLLGVPWPEVRDAVNNALPPGIEDIPEDMEE